MELLLVFTARAFILYKMKKVGIITVLAALSCSSLFAEDDANPYSSIVARNVFSLVPVPTNPPADVKQPDPPAKITPNGIMTLFGQLQVLFKVATPPKPGQPPQDQSYVMSEGDRQDGIEVTKIDREAAVITFNNHGIVQVLPLSVATGVNTPVAPVGGPAVPPGGHGMPLRGGRFGPGGMNGRLNQQQPPGNPNGSNPSTASSAPYSPNSTGNYNNGGNNYSGNNAANSQDRLSPEAQVLLMEQTRLNTQDEVNQGLMPPLPPTVLTPGDATGVGGAPLISPSSGPPAPP